MMATAERRFRAMGSDCHLIAVAPQFSDDFRAADAFIELAAARVELLEQNWSRFRESSELNQLNRSAGAGPIEVSTDLFRLVAHMKQAWLMSSGSFDPTVLSSLVALGYDADFASIVGRPASIEGLLAPAPGMLDIALDGQHMTVELPRGVGIDPGAIGKGLAADIIAAELMGAGAAGFLVNLGGDLAFAGVVPDGSVWSIAVEDERRPIDDPTRILRVLEFPAGVEAVGVATSTTLKRRWAQGRRHHVIDPRTGSMSTSDLVQVTVVASEAWRAEVIATTALLLPAVDAETWLRELDVSAILLTADRTLLLVDEPVPCG